jgi:hypothetical protein
MTIICRNMSTLWSFVDAVLSSHSAVNTGQPAAKGDQSKQGSKRSADAAAAQLLHSCTKTTATKAPSNSSSEALAAAGLEPKKKKRKSKSKQSQAPIAAAAAPTTAAAAAGSRQRQSRRVALVHAG